MTASETLIASTGVFQGKGDAQQNRTPASAVPVQGGISFWAFQFAKADAERTLKS